MRYLKYLQGASELFWVGLGAGLYGKMFNWAQTHVGCVEPLPLKWYSAFQSCQTADNNNGLFGQLFIYTRASIKSME